MDNKGQMGWIVGIIFIIIIVVGIIVLIAVLNQEKRVTQIQTNNSMNVYLIARDSNSKTSISGNYTISNFSSYINGEIIKDAFTEINNLSINRTQILCQSPGYYSTYLEKYFSNQELNQNISKIDCNLDQIGNIKVESSDKLVEGESLVTLAIISKGLYKNLTICSSWTSGVINVDINLPEEEPPNRYSKKVDKCFLIGKNIKDETINLEFNVKTKDLVKTDKLTFYLFDKDIIFNGQFIEASESGENLGNKEDTVIEILTNE